MHTTLMNVFPKSLHVAVTLVFRLANDLRSVQMLAGTGYPVQALALVASMYEVAHTAAFIGNDESLAQEWLDHDDPTRLFRNVRLLTKKALTKLDAGGAALGWRADGFVAALTAVTLANRRVRAGPWAK